MKRNASTPTACLVKPGAARTDFLGLRWDSPIGVSMLNQRPRQARLIPVGHTVGHTDALGGHELYSNHEVGKQQAQDY